MVRTVAPPQKALAIMHKGGPFTLIRQAVPIPTPGAGELLVRVDGVGLNPGEWKLQTGVADFPMTYPAFLGTEGAGTVLGFSEGVTRFNKKDRVLFQGWLDGKTSSYQQFVLIDASLTAKIPDTMSCLEASAIPLALATAALGLCQEFPSVAGQRGGAALKPFWEEDAEGYYAGKAILILGGGSMVGQYTIQIAKYMGFSPIIVTSSLKHTENLQSMGATHVIDRHIETTGAAERLKRELNIELEVVYDAVHCPISQAEVDMLSPNGTLVSIWELPKEGELQFKDGRRATATFGSVQMYKNLGKQMYARMEYFLEKGMIKYFLEKGMIKPPKIEKVAGGLGGVAEGLGRLQRNEVSGIKLVVNPMETPDF